MDILFNKDQIMRIAQSAYPGGVAECYPDTFDLLGTSGVVGQMLGANFAYFGKVFVTVNYDGSGIGVFTQMSLTATRNNSIFASPMTNNSINWVESFNSGENTFVRGTVQAKNFQYDWVLFNDITAIILDVSISCQINFVGWKIRLQGI